MLTTAALALALALPGGAEAAPPDPYPPASCPKVWRSTVARNRIRALLLSDDPYPDRRKVRRYVRCVETRAKARAGARVARKAWRARRTDYSLYWRIRFARLPSYAQQWAWSTGACESGNNSRTSTGNGFYGAFQWVPSTWYAAGGDRFPTEASWHHQAVLAWNWHVGHPSGQWPNCGE